MLYAEASLAQVSAGMAFSGVSNPQGQGAAMLPEDLGRNCARLLLEEIYRVCPQLLQVWERSTWKQFPCIFISNFLSL